MQTKASASIVVVVDVTHAHSAPDSLSMRRSIPRPPPFETLLAKMSYLVFRTTLTNKVGWITGNRGNLFPDFVSLAITITVYLYTSIYTHTHEL